MRVTEAEYERLGDCVPDLVELCDWVWVVLGVVAWLPVSDGVIVPVTDALRVCDRVPEPVPDLVDVPDGLVVGLRVLVKL